MQCRMPVPVPLHYREEVKVLIDENVKKGVMKKIPPGVPDTWCTRLLTPPKKNGRPRLVVDMCLITRKGLENEYSS